MLGKLNHYVFGSFFSVFVFFLFGLMGMLWLGQVVVLIDQIILRGETISTFFLLSGKLIPSIFMSVAPLAALGSSLFVLNSLAGNAELLVMQGAGMRPTRIALPFALMGLLLSVILFAFTFYLVPKSNRELRSSVTNIQNNYSQNVILAGQFIFPVEGITIFSNQSLASGEMVDIFIEDRRLEPFIRTYFAKRGLVQRDEEFHKIALIQGKIIDSNWETEEFSQIEFERTEISLNDSESEQNRTSIWTSERSSSELLNDFLRDPKKSNNARGELMQRATFPLLGFILPTMSALLFLSQPFSRHGYGKRIFIIATMGLSVATVQLAIPILVEDSFANMWIGILPLSILLLIYLITRLKTR